VHAPRDEVQVHVRGLVRLVLEPGLRSFDTEQDGRACFGGNEECCQSRENEKFSHASSFIDRKKRILFPHLSQV
jgi:hypothetical protein